MVLCDTLFCKVFWRFIGEMYKRQQKRPPVGKIFIIFYFLPVDNLCHDLQQMQLDTH